MVDLVLAGAHHLLAFGLVALLMGQGVLLKPERLDPMALSRLDAAYGATAVLVLAVGVARVAAGARGWDFYQANPFFWAKVATFGLIGLISIWPTLRFLAWRRALRRDPAFRPPAAEASRVRRMVGLEALLLVPLLAFAAAMARWPF